MYTISNKNLPTRLLFCLIVIFLVTLSFDSFAQMQAVGDKLSSEAQAFATNAKKVCGFLATGLLTIGLVMVLAKSATEESNAAKHYLKFIGAGVFFGAIWGCLSLFFQQ